MRLTKLPGPSLFGVDLGLKGVQCFCLPMWPLERRLMT
jgi:hypothetical protein